MEELQNEFLELQTLGLDGLDDDQRARFYELPQLIIDSVNAEKTASDEVKKTVDSALAQKEHFREKFEKEQAEKLALEKKLQESGKQGKQGLEVDDFIDISSSLDGLDQREKEYLAKTHKLTGKPLTEIRKDEDFVLWQDAYRQKVEKEKALKPSGKQSDDEGDTTLEAALESASLEDKEKLLKEHLGYDSGGVPQRADKVIRR